MFLMSAFSFISFTVFLLVSSFAPLMLGVISRSCAAVTFTSPRVIGLCYLLLGLLFMAVGMVCSHVIRISLIQSPFSLTCTGVFFNLIVTVHGLVMVFFFIMPTLFGGFGNLMLLSSLGLCEVVYPRFNNLSLLLLPSSFVVLVAGALGDFLEGPGWTLYAPLSVLHGINMSSLILVLMGLVLVGFSSTFTSVNFVNTTLLTRSVGIVVSLLPLLVYAQIITAGLLLLVLPVLLCLVIFAAMEVGTSASFFSVEYGGDPVLFQHLFWIFGHPEVYIIILPGFGVVSYVLCWIFGTSHGYGHLSMILAMVCIALLGLSVWAHHMFAAGLSSDTRAYFSVVTIMIALPTGTKIYNWSLTLALRFQLVPMLSLSITSLIIYFLVLFTLGGGTGVVLGNAALSTTIHDTYYVVAHFHFVLSLGASVALGVGLLLLMQVGGMSSKVSQNTLNLILGLVATYLLIIFTPLHSGAMPRRIVSNQSAFTSLGFIASIATISSLVSLLLLLL